MSDPLAELYAQMIDPKLVKIKELNALKNFHEHQLAKLTYQFLDDNFITIQELMEMQGHSRSDILKWVERMKEDHQTKIDDIKTEIDTLNKAP